KQQDNKLRKIPLIINGNGNISVVNQNDPAEKAYWTIVLYVVERSTAEQFSYEVYDVSYTNQANGATITPQASIVTFISAYDFRISAVARAQPRSVSARLVGFDNALDNNKDGCPYAYNAPASGSFAGFTLQSSSPLLSLSLDKLDGTIELHTDADFNSVRDIGENGFFSTPGWNGCTK
ncbi:hypothetical protein PENTCL1PPCAC_15287, partial [Pristionchus entomophagus]